MARGASERRGVLTRLRYGTFLPVACLWACSPSPPEGETSSEGTARPRPRVEDCELVEGLPTIVQVVVDNSYPEDKGEEFSILARGLPPRSVQLEPGDTLSAVIVREFGFGPSNLPEQYQSLEGAIAEANDIEDPDAVSPGSLLVPPLPRWGFAKHAPPVTRRLDVEYEAGTFRSEFEEPEPDRRAAKTLLSFQLPTNAAGELLLEGLAPHIPMIVGQPLVIHLAQGESGSGLNAALLDDAHIPVLRQRLTGRGGTSRSSSSTRAGPTKGRGSSHVTTWRH